MWDLDLPRISDVNYFVIIGGLPLVLEMSCKLLTIVTRLPQKKTNGNGKKGAVLHWGVV